MPWNETELAYLAGLLDGEGCVGVYCSFSELGTRQKVPRPVYKARLTITNTDRRMLDWVHGRFGGAIISRRAANERSKPVFRWSLQGINRVQALIKAVYPYLIVKQAQADLILRFPANELCNQWTKEKTAETRAAKRALYLETKRLNKRGPPDATVATH